MIKKVGYLPYNVMLKTTVWLFVIVYLGVIGTFFLIKSKRFPKVGTSQKFLFVAVALFFYMYIITRIFYILSDFERDANSATVLYYRYVAIGHIFIILALANIIFITEKYIINQSKYLLTYAFLIILGINVIILIFSPTLMPAVRYINYGLWYSQVIILLIIYLYLSVKTTGILRKKAFLTFIAIVVMMIGSIIESDALISSGLVSPYYTPIIFSIGATIFAYSQNIQI
ncbi:MAG: hypothetical protein GF383_07290 [Candidatus Lokiarchaeota archaeon]|nr:hypothetical protein [Candidatus Lokiarchaeota archaeon]MBD3339972.1 hypothetical protein [Candidatus Lokiarchaeota archaeon]